MVTSAPCPACGRDVARWTNGGRIPPHGKRRVRHKCPHGRWCAQANPLGGIHSNGGNRPTANGYGCADCNEAREVRLATKAYWRDFSAGFANGTAFAFTAPQAMRATNEQRGWALGAWAVSCWLNFMITAAHVVRVRERRVQRRGGQHAAP